MPDVEKEKTDTLCGHGAQVFSLYLVAKMRHTGNIPVRGISGIITGFSRVIFLHSGERMFTE